MSDTKRGPERGRYRARAASQTGFTLVWGDGTTTAVARLSRVLGAATGDEDVQLRTCYDNRLVAARRAGTWFTPDGNPTTDTPNFWTPGGYAPREGGPDVRQ